MTLDVRFVLAPFLPTNQPALGVSSLAATLEAQGYSAEVTYLNLDYLRRIGEDAYQLLAKFSQVTLLGEVIFARRCGATRLTPFRSTGRPSASASTGNRTQSSPVASGSRFAR